MANINVMNAVTGQVEVKDTADVTVASVQDLTILTSTPTEFSHVILQPAANGMVKAGAITHTAILADAITAVNTARAGIVADMTTALAGKEPTITPGTTSQYYRGDKTWQTLPTPVDISGKSTRSNFTALSTLGAHGVADSPADAVTNYNVVTTLLGALTGAVNAANAKQNDIATKLNQLLDWLTTGNIPAINNLRIAGAA